MLIQFDFMYILCYNIITLNIFGGGFMYVKVHKIGKKWFRNDTGALVGVDVIPGTETFNRLKHLLGDRKFFIQTPKKQHLAVYYGYFDKKRTFIHFCNKQSCSKCTGFTSSIFCHRISDRYKASGGYFIKTH